jgi:ribosome-associated protein
MDSKDLSQKIIDTLEDKKAENICLIELKEKGAFADYMIVATATSTRQVFALSQHLEQVFKSYGVIPHIEGIAQCEWVLLFGKDIVVHIFLPEIRSFYQLEKMWGTPFNDEDDDHHKTLR